MKFITNRISTGKSTGFSDFVTKLAASNASLSKTAQVANFGDKKAEPFGKKEEGKAKKEDKKDDKKEEECETSCASSSSSVKTAKEKAKEGKDGITKVKMQKMDPVGGTNTGKPGGEKKKASNSDVSPENKGVVHSVDECCGAPTSKTDDGSEASKGKKSGKTEVAKVEVKVEEKKASAVRFVRIANLDSKTKSAWKAYWKNLYPTEYVDAMFADK